MTDEVLLVDRLKRNDAGAWTQIYDRHYQQIYNYLYYQLRGASEAEDLAAEVFLRAIEAIGSYTPRGLPLVSWLYRIGHNLVVDHLRRQSRRDQLPLQESLVWDHESSGGLLESKIEKEELLRALQYLTVDQRQVLILKFVQEMDNSGVAQVLGKTEGAVKSIQHRALASLKRVLERTQ
ncbi:MAG: sigma-70 family RNA polymerase sigma factor [Chloroflexi bacterium]|nr:sigma-70 family RNA polymerase sigma factor [Chloroflexota bacterium]